MRQNLRVSLGAVVLALATLAAVIFALINFDQRSRFEVVYDGVAWLDTDHGIQASRISPNSPATRAGIRPGDILLTINTASVTRAAEVARRLDRAGLWTQVRYKLSRDGEEFETPLLTAPAEKPLATENYLRMVGRFICLSAYSFSSAGGMPRARCTFTFFAWSLSFSGRSISAESWTPLTGKFTGRRSSRACWLLLCCCTLRWHSRDGRKQPFARLRNCWRCTPCRSPWF